MLDLNKKPLETLEPAVEPQVPPPAPVEEPAEEINYGPAAAAFLAAGIGLTVYGLLIVMVEAFKGFKTFMTMNNDVGPLSGKTIYAVIIWLLVWVGLHFTLRNGKVNFSRYLIATGVLIGVALVLSFPLFFHLFTAK